MMALVAEDARSIKSGEKFDRATQSGSTGKSLVGRQHSDVECLRQRDVACVVTGQVVS